MESEMPNYLSICFSTTSTLKAEKERRGKTPLNPHYNAMSTSIWAVTTRMNIVSGYTVE